MNVDNIISQMTCDASHDNETDLWYYTIYWMGHKEIDDCACSEYGSDVWIAIHKKRIAERIVSEYNTIKLVTRCGCSRYVTHKPSNCRDYVVPLCNHGRTTLGSPVDLSEFVRFDQRHFVFNGETEGEHKLIRIFEEKQ
jgi:hypothetical protein